MSNSIQVYVEPERTGALVSPVTGSFKPFHYTTRLLEVSNIHATIEGDTSPSVTFTVRWGSSIISASGGTEIMAGGETTTNNTTGEDFNGGDFDGDPTIPAGNHIWIVTSTVSGTVRQFNVTLTFA